MTRHPAAAPSGAAARIRRSWTTWSFVAVVIVAALLQARLAVRPGLWVDEVFSLAVATGHSIEHPAADARPVLGDFIEHPAPEPPATLAAYAVHDDPPASVRRVLRAVLLSDTSPPLYYVLLSLWTRVAGTSDAALRLFSSACALLCLPLLWRIGQAIGGRSTALIACVLFAFAPPVLYFAAEGRMYALTWVFTSALVWLGLRLARDGPTWPRLAAWAVVGAAGLLTHYFYAFVWAGVALWLCLYAPRSARPRLAAAAVATALLVLPWYARLPESLARWRVTGGWLDGELTAVQMVRGPLILVQYMFFWGEPAYRDKGELLAGALLLVVLPLAMLRHGLRRYVTGRPLLLALCVAGAAVGPVVFDLLLGTMSSQINRYGLAGLPAALLLLAVATGALPRPARAAFVALLVVSWWPGLRGVFSEPARPWHPFPRIAERLEAWHRAGGSASSDLVLVHAIPTGSIGLARYLGPDGPPIASWTPRLGQRRTREDLDALLAGRCRVALVKVHDLEDPLPAEEWLHEQATLERRRVMGRAIVQYFTLHGRAADDSAATGCAAADSVARAPR